MASAEAKRRDACSYRGARLPNCDSVNQATLPGVLFLWWVFVIETEMDPFLLRRPCSEVQNRQLIPPVSP